MKRIYIASDPITANLLKARLEDAGIPAIVQDERTQSLQGEVPFVYPTVWVENGDETEARKLALQLERPQNAEAWACPTCGEVLDSSFSECWSCSAKQAEKADEAPEPVSGPADKKFYRTIGVVALIVFLTVLFGVYRAYRYQQYSDHFQIGYDHHMALRYDAAIKHYDQAIEWLPGRSDVLMNRGSAWFAKADYARAIQDFDAVIQIDPKAEGVFSARGSSHFELGHARLSLQDYLAALSARPFDSEVKIAVMASKYELADLAGAMQDAENLRASGAYGSEAARFRSAIHSERGEAEKAMQEAELAISLDPKNPDVYTAKAGLLLSAGEFAKAIELCEEARKHSGGMPVYERVIRGAALYRLGKLEEAQAVMKEVPALAGNRRHEIGCLVTAYLILDNETEARRCADEVLKRSPEDRYSYYLAAEVAYWFGRKGDANARAQGIERALAYLEDAKKHGFIAWFCANNDVFLRDLVDHPRFKKLAGLP